MASKIRFRRDTKANWLLANPLLDDGEFVIETDTHQYKIGNGSQSYSALPYRGLPVESTTGSSTTTAMSQKAVTDLHNTLKSGSISSSSITQDFGNDDTKVISQKGYTDDMKAWLPSSVYSDRVALDGGSIRDKSMLKSMYDDTLNLLPNTDLWYNFECGIKTRVSGLNTYVTKVYDLSANNRDAVQPTKASQPYLVGNINPANRLAIFGGTTKELTFTTLNKGASDKWSVAFIAKLFGTSSHIALGLGGIFLSRDALFFINTDPLQTDIPHREYVVGTTHRYYLVAKGDGNLQYWRDGRLISSANIGFSGTSMLINSLVVSNVELKDFRVFNKDLNKYEMEFLDAKMSAFYPQFEGVVIGNQVWEASNAMDIVSPDGTIIPEVTDNTAWAALTTPAWCYFNNSEANGAVYGRIYNGYAVQKLTGSPIWRAPMSADFTQLSAFLGGNAVAGGKMKADGLTYWASPNTGATNESGFTAIAGGYRAINGIFVPFVNINWSIDGGWLGLYSDTGAMINRQPVDVLSQGFSLRRLRRIPPGALIREITSGVFSTNITGGTFKDIAIPNMYRITGVKVTSAQALTNFILEARTSAGVLVQNLLSGKSIGAGKSIIFSVVADMEVMLQDYIARATAVGNGGAGMEIELIIEKIKV